VCRCQGHPQGGMQEQQEAAAAVTASAGHLKDPRCTVWDNSRQQLLQHMLAVINPQVWRMQQTAAAAASVAHITASHQVTACPYCPFDVDGTCPETIECRAAPCCTICAGQVATHRPKPVIPNFGTSSSSS
jgi:hypothetical protein